MGVLRCNDDRRNTGRRPILVVVVGPGIDSRHLFSNYFAGMTGSIRADGCWESCKMVLAAETKCRADLISSPVFRLRSNRGKLLLEISRRSECPRRNTLLVPHRSTEIW